MSRISETDLILNDDGSVYHLNLLPEDIADTIITVGDPERVTQVSKYFDRIDVKKSKREFVSHTGNIGNKRIMVLSTGIGTDNIDIVLNELDALVNVDFQTRQVKTGLKSLNIIRIGTSGAVQADVPVDSLLISGLAIGMDALMHYYQHQNSAADTELLNEFKFALPADSTFSPYIASANEALMNDFSVNVPTGISISAPGFYAPQGREVRAKATMPGLLNAISKFSYAGQRITNLEMETAGIYGLAGALGHRAISFNAILANRITQEFSSRPLRTIDTCIETVLERITSNH
jgi:uridine phosphorylase